MKYINTDGRTNPFAGKAQDYMKGEAFDSTPTPSDIKKAELERILNGKWLLTDYSHDWRYYFSKVD